MRRRLTLPLGPDEARTLRAGDDVLVTGRIVTAREAAHRRLLRHPDPRLRGLCRGSFVYHCSPIVDRDPDTGKWTFAAAGPSASIRMEAYQGDVIARYGLCGVIGRGGMGGATLAALREHGAVYLHAVGGLAVGLAQHVTSVDGPYLVEVLGPDEAIWSVEVSEFPAVVTMDAHGVSLHVRSAPSVRSQTGARLP